LFIVNTQKGLFKLMNSPFLYLTNYEKLFYNKATFNTKTTYKIVQYFASFWLSHCQKYATVATATIAFFSLTKQPRSFGVKWAIL